MNRKQQKAMWAKRGLLTKKGQLYSETVSEIKRLGKESGWDKKQIKEVIEYNKLMRKRAVLYGKALK